MVLRLRTAFYRIDGGGKRVNPAGDSFRPALVRPADSVRSAASFYIWGKSGANTEKSDVPERLGSGEKGVFRRISTF
jgi:hypothetical protein